MSYKAKVLEKSPSQLTGETRELLPINEVFHSNFDLFDVIENIKLRQVERIIAINLARMLHHDEIQPATSPTAAGRRTKLAPDLLKMCPDILCATPIYMMRISSNGVFT